MKKEVWWQPMYPLGTVHIGVPTSFDLLTYQKPDHIRLPQGTEDSQKHCKGKHVQLLGGPQCVTHS